MERFLELVSLSNNNWIRIYKYEKISDEDEGELGLLKWICNLLIGGWWNSLLQLIKDSGGRLAIQTASLAWRARGSLNAYLNSNFGCSLPVLSFKVRLGEENEVLYDYYEKETKSDKVILASSALPWYQKREIHTNELERRLRNTSQKLGEKVQNDHLNEYMIRLKDCGYNDRFRANTVKRAKKSISIKLKMID